MPRKKPKPSSNQSGLTVWDLVPRHRRYMLICIDAAGGDVATAQTLYRRWDYGDVFEWWACTEAQSWQPPPRWHFTDDDDIDPGDAAVDTDAAE